MKRIVKGLVLSGLMFANSAFAGIPVIDGVQNARGIAEFMQTLVQWADELAAMNQQYEQLVRQSEQLEQTYESMTGSRGMGQIGRSDMEYLPEDWESAVRMMDNGEGLGNEAQVLRDGNKVLDTASSTMDEASGTMRQVRRMQNQTAFNHTLNKESYKRASQRIINLMELLDTVDETTDPKEVEDLQARIQSEQTLLQNEQVKLDMMARLQQSEKDMNEQTAREMSMKYSNWKDVDW